MTEEQLKHANELTSTIKLLEDHLKKLLLKDDPANGLNYYDTSCMFVKSSRHSTAVELIEEYLVIQIPEFMEIYITKIERHIKFLKKQLEEI